MARGGLGTLPWVVVALAGCIGSPEFFAGGGGGSADGGGGEGTGGGGGATHNGGGTQNGGGSSGGTAAAGGANGGFGGQGGAGGIGPPDASTFLPPEPSRSSTLAYAPGNQFLFAVNPDVPGIVAMPVFNGAPRTTLLFNAGASPSSIAVDANGIFAAVTLRKGNSLARVVSASTSPMLQGEVQVCAEPTGVVLTSDSETAVVACFGEPYAVIVNFSAPAVRTTVKLPGVARALALNVAGTRAYLPLFYGTPTAEGLDMGREGHLIELDVQGGVVLHDYVLRGRSDTGYGPLLADGGEGPHVGCSPNQLAAIAYSPPFVFIPQTCVSPWAPATATSTVFSAMSVFDMTAGQESSFSPIVLGLRTPSPIPLQSMLAGLVDVDVAQSGTVYALAQGANRVVPLSVLPPFGIQSAGMLSSFGLSGCNYGQVCPASVELQGVALSVRWTPSALYVNDWTARALLRIETFGGVTAQQYDTLPPVGTPEHDALEGRFLFYTAQDRWSRNEAGSCASCHPDALSDNVTWMFSAGPRQTPPLDGTFAKADAGDHRAQNWTANFDEIYDVEGVVRNVLGGRGALVIGSAVDAGETLISLSHGVQLDGVFSRNDNLSGSTRTVDTELSSVHEWGLIEKFIEGVRTNHAPLINPGSPQSGRTVFATGGCAQCHGGPKWSVSRVPYTPSPMKNGSLVGDNALPSAPTGLRTELRDAGTSSANTDVYKVANELVPNPDGGVALDIGPERITCVLRDVGTFDVSHPLEHKPDGTRAQGQLGFNPPSLLGLATSAPYFHDGSAKTLSDVLAVHAHLVAGNAAFNPTSQDLLDLSDFLRSIDETTLPFPVPPGADLCGGY